MDRCIDQNLWPHLYSLMFFFFLVVVLKRSVSSAPTAESDSACRATFADHAGSAA